MSSQINFVYRKFLWPQSKSYISVFQLTDLSRAIYSSCWYEQNVKIKKILLFIMMKAQRQKYLSAAGIIDINVDAFGSVSYNIKFRTFKLIFFRILDNFRSAGKRFHSTRYWKTPSLGSWVFLGISAVGYKIYQIL